MNQCGVISFYAAQDAIEGLHQQALPGIAHKMGGVCNADAVNSTTPPEPHEMWAFSLRKESGNRNTYGVRTNG